MAAVSKYEPLRRFVADREQAYPITRLVEQDTIEPGSIEVQPFA